MTTEDTTQHGRDPDGQTYIVDLNDGTNDLPRGEVEDWSEITSWLPWLALEALSIAKKDGTQAAGVKAVADHMQKNAVPGTITHHSQMQGVGLSAMRVARIVKAMVHDYGELSHLKEVKDQIRVKWFTQYKAPLGTLWTQQGATIPKARREELAENGEDWLFDLRLSLPAWLLRDELGRRRMVYEALEQLTFHTTKDGVKRPRRRDTRGTLSSPGAVARFGLGNRDQALAMLAGQMHDTTEQRLDEWNLTGDQLDLFAAMRGPDGTINKGEAGEHGTEGAPDTRQTGEAPKVVKDARALQERMKQLSHAMAQADDYGTRQNDQEALAQACDELGGITDKGRGTRSVVKKGEELFDRVESRFHAARNPQPVQD